MSEVISVGDHIDQHFCYFNFVFTLKEGTFVQAQQFIKQLEEHDLPLLIAVGGEERTWVSQCLEIVRRKALLGGMADFNYDRLDASTASIQDIVNTAKMLPTMAKYRLVEVEHADQIKFDAKNDVFMEYLKNPCAETILLLVFDKYDQRGKAAKTIHKLCTSMRFKHPKEHEIFKIIKERAVAYNLSISDQVAQSFALTVGTELGFLDRALEKLALVCDGEITLEAVSEHVANSHLGNSFAFVQAVAVSDRKKALTLLRVLEMNRTSCLALMGLLAWQLRQVLKASLLQKRGENFGAISKQLRLFGDGVAVIKTASALFPQRSHEKRLGRLAFFDRQFKSTPIGEFHLMERLVFELCPERQRAT